MKDNPTTRRPPAGLGIDDPDPLGSGATLASPEALAGPTYADNRVIHSPLRRCETMTAHTLDDASRARQSASCAVPGRNAREKCASTLDSTLRASHCACAPRTTFSLVRPAWRRPQNDARRDLGGRARGSVTAVRVAVELPHRHAAPATRSQRPVGPRSNRGLREAGAHALQRSPRPREVCEVRFAIN